MSTLIDLLQKQLANNDVPDDPEMIDVLAESGVPVWLARFYVERHRPTALCPHFPDFEEKDPMVNACVRVGLGCAEGESMLDDDMLPHVQILSDSVRQILALVRLRDRLKELGFGTDEPINGGDVVDAVNSTWAEISAAAEE